MNAPQPPPVVTITDGIRLCDQLLLQESLSAASARKRVESVRQKLWTISMVIAVTTLLITCAAYVSLAMIDEQQEIKVSHGPVRFTPRIYGDQRVQWLWCAAPRARAKRLTFSGTSKRATS